MYYSQTRKSARVRLRDVIHKRLIVATAWAVLNASVKIINMDMVMVTTRAPQNGTGRGQEREWERPRTSNIKNCTDVDILRSPDYDCFEDLNLLIFSSSQLNSDLQEFEFAKKLTIRTRLSHVILLSITWSFHPKLTLTSPITDELIRGFYIADDQRLLEDQDWNVDTSSMCAVVMNTPKGNIFLDSESPTQMFLIGGFDGEKFNQW